MALGRISAYIATITLLALTPLLTPASATDKSEPEALCKKGVAAKGYPDLIKSIASLSALRSWSQTVNNKHGSNYSMWHNAKSQAMECEQKENSDFFVCIVSGKPCKATTANRPAKQALKRQAPKGL